MSLASFWASSHASSSGASAGAKILLGFFLIFFGYTFVIARSHAEGDETEAIKEMPIGKSALFIVAGLAGLIYGGQFFVDGSSQIVRSLGVSESVIGLTLVAGGMRMA